MISYWFKKAYLANGWQSNVTISVSPSGEIIRVSADSEKQGATVIEGLAMPGFPNIHSHAFQRAMAGLSEQTASANDSFWTWRNVMYQFANLISPADQQAIAAQLYMEMLKSGFTSVAEFHYLHHQPGGQHYENPAEMSLAIIKAAKIAGIGLTHLPVLYMSSNFGGGKLKEQQLRFYNSIESYQSLLLALSELDPADKPEQLGIALHSLRAVPAEAIAETVNYLEQLDNTAPIHIHIAEQMLEVEESIQWSGKRPVEWLLANCSVDQRWCLIHATHVNESETQAMAQSGAVAGLCPTTEANLGDGLFPLAQYLQRGGKLAIGSDSNTSVSPVEELRWLEYGQRLQHQGRNIAATAASPHTAQHLIDHSLAGGAAALGRKIGKIAQGFCADLLVLDDNSPHLYAKPNKNILDAFVFSGNNPMVRDVMRGGNWVVKNYKHINEDSITNHYRETIARLQEKLF